MANLAELESAIKQLPQSEIRQLIDRLQDYVSSHWKDKGADEGGSLSYDQNAMPIWELAARISAMVPDEEWKKLPTDLAARFDYYQEQAASEEP